MTDLKQQWAHALLDWQPIETAPKDGTEILVYGSWMRVGTWMGMTLATWLPHEEMWTFDGDIMERITHWMPLPPPPKKEKRNDKTDNQKAT